MEIASGAASLVEQCPYSFQIMAAVLRKRSSGRQRLRQGYVGKTFTLEGRSYVVEDVIAEGNILCMYVIAAICDWRSLYNVLL